MESECNMLMGVVCSITADIMESRVLTEKKKKKKDVDGKEE